MALLCNLLLVNSGCNHIIMADLISLMAGHSTECYSSPGNVAFLSALLTLGGYFWLSRYLEILMLESDTAHHHLSQSLYLHHHLDHCHLHCLYFLLLVRDFFQNNFKILAHCHTVEAGVALIEMDTDTVGTGVVERDTDIVDAGNCTGFGTGVVGPW